MRGVRIGSVVSFLLLLGACSSEAPSSPALATAGASGDPASGASSKALAWFEGSVDVASRTLSVTMRSPEGEITSQTTLPYGTATGDVYFHTCGTPAYAAHTLTASVQAVNLTGATVSGMIAVIDSVVPSTVTPSAPVIATYGSVASNTANCAAGTTLTWSFSDPSDTNFTFIGHAEAAPAFFDDFQSLSSSTTGAQCTTGDTVYAYATLSSWTLSGLHAIHGVQWQPGNLAAQLFDGSTGSDGNSMVMNASAAANQSGTTYTVRFLGGPGNWNSCGQGTVSGDGLVFNVLRANSTVLKTFTYSPPIWSGTESLTPNSFTYTGDGSGNVKLQVSTIAGRTGTFGGAIDDLGIY